MLPHCTAQPHGTTWDPAARKAADAASVGSLPKGSAGAEVLVPEERRARAPMLAAAAANSGREARSWRSSGSAARSKSCVTGSSALHVRGSCRVGLASSLAYQLELPARQSSLRSPTRSAEERGVEREHDLGARRRLRAGGRDRAPLVDAVDVGVVGEARARAAGERREPVDVVHQARVAAAARRRGQEPGGRARRQHANTKPGTRTPPSW